MQTQASMLLAAILVLASACKATEFKGDARRGKAQGGSDGTPGDGKGDGTDDNQNGEGKTPGGDPDKNGDNGNGNLGTDGSNQEGKLGTSTDASSDGNGLLIEDGGLPCLPKILPLHIMFAIDSTKSMDDEIDAVRNNVVQFAAKMLKIKPIGSEETIKEVKVGAVSYVDLASDNLVIPLSDPASFQTQMGAVKTRGGFNDDCEGGLQAAKAAFDVLDQAYRQTPGGSIPMLIVISDNYSHDGMQPEGARTFNFAPTAAMLQQPAFSNALLFDSTPTTNDVPNFFGCATLPAGLVPSNQWRDIRSAWSAFHPQAKVTPGRNLGFPFTQTTIMSDLPNELARVLRLCH